MIVEKVARHYEITCDNGCQTFIILPTLDGGGLGYLRAQGWNITEPQGPCYCPNCKKTQPD